MCGEITVVPHAVTVNSATNTPKINLLSRIEAPIRINQHLGSVDFIVKGNVISSEKIYALKRVEEGNLYRKTYDFIANFFIEDQIEK